MDICSQHAKVIVHRAEGKAVVQHFSFLAGGATPLLENWLLPVHL